MGSFGITVDTKSRNMTPIEAPRLDDSGNWVFPIAKLLSVKSHIAKNKDDEEMIVIDFHFKTKDGKEYLHREFTVEDDATKYDVKKAGLDSRLKHIYEAFSTFPEKGIGTKAKNWVEYFDAVAEAFKGVFTNTLVHLKLTWYNNRTKFPLNPNFIEAFIEGKPCRTLSINKGYDKIVQDDVDDIDDVPTKKESKDYDFDAEEDNPF